jgi:2-keto-4-pentenoate hydratase/2-oxohepta-3-ene-1,7-dioic acid hydratase in catechol pathway
VRLLAPVLPSKVVAVGRNYAEHAREMGHEVPTDPVIFLKPSTSVIGPDDAIVRPEGVGRVDYEGELAVIIGKLVRRLGSAEAIQAVLGFTCANDVTARDLQRSDVQWTRGKGFDTFCPLGPWIETDLDSSDLAVHTLVNGEPRQQARTSQLEHGVADLLAFVSRVMTLLPGDVLLTGTPAGVGPLEVGDRVEVEIEGIGVLANDVVAEPVPGVRGAQP